MTSCNIELVFEDEDIIDIDALEKELGVSFPDNIEKVIETNYADFENITKYLRQLNALEKQAYTIAKSHLGSSFNILRSNGFSDFMAKQK